MIHLASSAFALFLIIGEMNAFAAASRAKPASTCGTAFAFGGDLSAYSLESYTLQDIVTTDPKANILVKYPSMMLSAVQRYARILEREQRHLIKDPLYGVERLRMWPIFHEGSEKAGGRLIIGQEKQVDEVAQQIIFGGHGNKVVEKLFTLRGPSGSGKTEFLHILERLRAWHAFYDEAFYEFTFEWINLNEIPELGPLVESINGNPTFPNQMKRSPLVLLPRPMQQQIIEAFSDEIAAKTGFRPDPFLIPDGHSRQITEAIIKHNMTKHNLKTLSGDKFVEFLSRYVKIIRRIPPVDKPANIIEHQPKDPQWEALFQQENLFRRGSYPGTPLAYDFTGLFFQCDGGLCGLNEFFRNHPSLRSTFLEPIENRVVNVNGAPTESIDTLFVGTDNNESIDHARETGPSHAHVDRSNRSSWDYSTHPYEIMALATLMTGIKNFGAAPLQEGAQVKKIKNLRDIFPLPDADGKLVAIDRAYSLRYLSNGKGQETLIAPLSLSLLGWTVAASRMVNDPAKLKNHLTDLHTLKDDPNHRYVTDLTTRLQIITRDFSVPGPMRDDLTRLRDILKEGTGGITARDVLVWLSIALQMAQEHNWTLTPNIMDAAFRHMIDKDKFLNGADRNKWLKLHNEILRKLLLPKLGQDILKIISGDNEKTKRIYDEVASECLALSRNESAEEHISPSTGKRTEIKRDRLKAIKEAYQTLHGRELVYSDLLDVHAVVSTDNAHEIYAPLMSAVEHYLMKSEIDTSAMSSAIDFMRGQVGVDGRDFATQARRMYDSTGYNEQAFIEALELVLQLRRQTESDKPK